MDQGVRSMGQDAPASELVVDIFRKAWWALAFRGLVAIALGIVALGWPGVTLFVLMAIIGIYFFLDGVLTLVATFHAARDGRSWWPYLLQGLLGIGVGLVAFIRPVSFVFAVTILVGLRAILMAATELAAATYLRREMGASFWLLAIGSVVTLLFGVFLLVRPTIGAMSLVWLFGIQCLLFGSLLVAAAFGARGSARRLASVT